MAEAREMIAEKGIKMCLEAILCGLTALRATASTGGYVASVAIETALATVVGVILGLIIIWLIKRKAQKKGIINRRTVRRFQTTDDVWGIVDNWASQRGYQIVEQNQNSRHYICKKLRNVQIEAGGQGFVLEAWFNFQGREDLALESGGMFGSFPRKQTREDVNILLAKLGLEMIK